MPRWKALPEELNPRVREFTDTLRSLVDRCGLGLDALADRTGYGRDSWERYLDGWFPVPGDAVLALARVTGADPVRLTALWELAEGARSRAGSRGDRTPESAITAPLATTAPGAPAGAPRVPAPPYGDRGATPAPVAARATPVRRAGRTAAMFFAGALGTLLVFAAALLLSGPDEDGTAAPAAGPAADPKPADPNPAAPSAAAPSLPAGVGCHRRACEGRDPHAMGCGGPYGSTVASTIVGTALVEVRYSGVCGATWARVSRAAPGDTVEVTTADTVRSAAADADGDAYTPMVVVPTGIEASACATLQSGATGCTELP